MFTRNQSNRTITDYGFVVQGKKWAQAGTLRGNQEAKHGKGQRVPLGQISGHSTSSHRASVQPNTKPNQKREAFEVWHENDENSLDKNASQIMETSQMSIMEMSQMSATSSKSTVFDMSIGQEDSFLFMDAPSSVVMKTPHKKEPVSVEESESVYVTATSQVSSSLGPNEAFYSCPAFTDDIFKYLRGRETKFRPRLSYMQKQSEITIQMRSILIDWFIDVINEYNLHRSTLFLTVSILDRTLSYLDCPRLKLQLLGAASVMLASKYEEIYPPEVKDMVYITDDSYTKQQVINMEKIVLKVLDYNLSSPTSFTFASMLVFRLGLTPPATSLVWYLLELSLMHFDLLAHKSSDLATAAVLLAAFVVDRRKSVASMPTYWNVDVKALRAPINDLLRIFHQAPADSLTAIFSKYSESKYFNVVGLNLPSVVPKELFI